MATAACFPLPWSHYVKLLSIENTDARAFYETEALRGGWTVRQLDRQINSQFYERTALSKNKAAVLKKGALARPADAVTPEEEIRSPYVLEFLGLKDDYSENDLEELVAVPPAFDDATILVVIDHGGRQKATACGGVGQTIVHGDGVARRDKFLYRDRDFWVGGPMIAEDASEVVACPEGPAVVCVLRRKELVDAVSAPERVATTRLPRDSAAYWRLLSRPTSLATEGPPLPSGPRTLRPLIALSSSALEPTGTMARRAPRRGGLARSLLVRM